VLRTRIGFYICVENIICWLFGNCWTASQIQKVAKGFGHDGHPILRAAGGATIGSIFGPVGFALGGLFGLLSTPEDPKNKIPIQECPKCGVQFRFWGSINSGFYCPHCLEFYTYKE